MTIPDSEDWDWGTSPFYMSAWIKPESKTITTPIIARQIDGSNYWYMALVFDHLRTTFAYEGNLVVLDSATSDITLGEWQHLALTRSASNVWGLYVNGERVATETNALVATPAAST